MFQSVQAILYLERKIIHLSTTYVKFVLLAYSIFVGAVYMSRAILANQAELCHENLSSTQKDHLNELYAVVAVIRILLSELARLTGLARLI